MSCVAIGLVTMIWMWIFIGPTVWAMSRNAPFWVWFFAVSWFTGGIAGLAAVFK